MMVIFPNFECQEPLRNNDLFGICDDQIGTKAYTDVIDENKWMATVINPTQIEVTFTAIDNCIEILKPETNNKESTCDGMLTFKNNIFLVELKNQRTGGWLADAEAQLENTAKLLIEHHDLKEFTYKKAFACNRKHPHFVVLDPERKKAFFSKTQGFRLDAQAKIKI